MTSLAVNCPAGHADPTAIGRNCLDMHIPQLLGRNCPDMPIPQLLVGIDAVKSLSHCFW